MDCAYNIITANFSGGKTHATTARVYQWSRGIELCTTGADNLPQTFKAHFSVQKKGGVATTIVGIDERVKVPNVLFTIGKDIHVWLGASETEDDAEILYTVDIPVAPAPMPEYYDAEDTGVFDAVVEQVADYAATATAAANNAGASATAAAGSASAAAASASSAAGSAGAAEQARADAVTAKGQAETAAQTATEKAQQTAQNASQAALDAGRTESAAERAESAETGAGAAKTAAEAAAQSAAASAATADEKATLAGQSATAAAGSASAAAHSAASIEGDVQIASQKASEAQTAAGQAVTAKEAAQTAQQGAETAATNAGQSASTATAKAAEAATSASNAAQSKTDAEAAAARAEQAAATLTVDTALSDSSTNPVQNKVITSEITDVKNAIEQITNTSATFITGSFVNVNGIVSSGKKFAKSNEIELAKGCTITAYLKSFSTVFSAVAVKNADGTYTKKVESNTNSSWGEVTYTATSDCIIVLSTWSDDGDVSKAKAYIYINGKDLQNNLIDLQNQIDETTGKFGKYASETLSVAFTAGHYVDYQGIYRPNNDFSVSDIIPVVKSQVLSFTAKGAGTVVALLARVDDDGTYTPIINCTDSNPKSIVYQSDRNQRLIISTNKTYTVTVNSYYNDNTFRLLVNDAIKTVPKISERQKWLYANKFNDGNFDAELNMFICYGQSWAEGYDAHAVSLTRRYDNIMLNTGVKNNPLESTSVTANSFSPMVEADGVDGTQLCGETPVSSQCNMVKQLIEDEDGYLYTDFPYQMIGIAPGYGSQSLAQLSKGTDWYNRLIAMVTAANNIAAGLGKKLVVQAFSWTQNAKGALSGTYAENLEQLRADIDADVKAITGQAQTVKCITWQTFLYEANGAADCYAKYVGASETYPNIICAGASYQFPHISANNLHLTSIGQLWTGSMFGVAYKRTIIDGEKFIPLKPISATYSGKELYITFNVPQKPLKIDTDMVESASNYGFNITNGGTEKTINSVTIINPDTVRIICADNISPEDHVTYAQNAGTTFGPISGNRGNLCDSQGNYIQYTAEDGSVLRVDNWCVVFDKTVGELVN